MDRELPPYSEKRKTASQPYVVKKKHIYAMRKRRSVFNHLARVNAILDTASKKDLEKFGKALDAIDLKIKIKQGIFDGLKSSRSEIRESTTEKKLKNGEIMNMDVISPYICPICKKPGYLYSDNLDGRTHNLHLIHISTDLTVRFCKLGKTNPNLIRILDPPQEGILRFYKY